MGAEFIDQRIAPLRVAPGDEALAEELYPHRRAFVLGELARQQCRNPIAAEQPSHRAAGAGLGEEIVLVLLEHQSFLLNSPDPSRRSLDLSSSGGA